MAYEDIADTLTGMNDVGESVTVEVQLPDENQGTPMVEVKEIYVDGRSVGSILACQTTITIGQNIERETLRKLLGSASPGKNPGWIVQAQKELEDGRKANEE